MEIKNKRPSKLTYLLVISIGFSIFFLFFYSEYRALKKYYLNPINDSVILKKNTRSGGTIFKLSKSKDNYINFHLTNADEQMIKISDSVSKEKKSSELKVYRKIKNKMELFNIFYIDDSETFYKIVVAY